ncbi:MAG TPA: patatin-like phospholipase family protein, partial [Acidimicrobiales bacterium]|nr:patatin-like phospholipase family protein [Acidimicrobiales bacterium]
SSLLDAPSSSPSTSSLLDAPSSSPLPLALSLVDAAMQLATSCATLRGQAAVVRPADGQHPELGTPDEGLVSPRSPEDLEGFGDENKHDEVVVLPAPSGSVADAAVRMARDYSVVIVPVAREALETSGGAGHGLLDACDWHVLVGESGSEEEPGRRPGTLVASMTHDQKSVDRVARLICRRRVGVALGSGSIRGFAHGGVLSVLEDQQIPIDFLAGSSAGAIAGSLYLRGNDPREFADIGKALREAARTGLPSLSGISAKAIFSGRRLRNYLAKALGRDTTFEDLPVPFVVAATDLEAGGPVHIESGSLVEAVSASAAMPGVFPPVTIEGRRLGDGGTTDPVPVSALRALGADVVVAVNVMNVSSGFLGTTPSRIPIPIPSLVENLFMGIDSITSQIAVESCRLADIVVTPTAPDTRWFDVLPFRAYETAGREAMTLALPELCALLGRS